VLGLTLIIHVFLRAKPGGPLFTWAVGQFLSARRSRCYAF
jgi:hypothetical protein